MLPFSFHMGSANENSVSHLFLDNYQIVEQALKNNKLKEVSSLLKNLQEHVKTLLEHVHYNNLLATFYRITKEPQNEMSALKYVVVLGEQILDKNIYYAAVENLFILQVQQNKYADALNTFKKLNKLTTNPQQLTKLKKVKNLVVDYIKSDKVLAFNSEVEKGKKVYRHNLSRRSISLKNTNGSINKLQLRCDYHFESYDAEKQKEWQLPESWGKCQLNVYGESGSQFTIVEQHAS